MKRALSEFTIAQDLLIMKKKPEATHEYKPEATHGYKPEATHEYKPEATHERVNPIYACRRRRQSGSPGIPRGCLRQTDPEK